MKEKKTDTGKKRMSIRATAGRYFFWNYGKAKGNLTLDLSKMTKDLNPENAIVGLVNNRELRHTQIQIIVTKKDGIKVTKQLSFDKVLETEGDFKYVAWKTK